MECGQGLGLLRGEARRRVRSASRRAEGAEEAAPWIPAAAGNRCFLGEASALRGRSRRTPPHGAAVETSCRVPGPVRRIPPRGCRARLAGTPQFSLSPGSPSESQSIQILGESEGAALLSRVQACVSQSAQPAHPSAPTQSLQRPTAGSGIPAGAPGEGTLAPQAPLEPFRDSGRPPLPKEKRSLSRRALRGDLSFLPHGGEWGPSLLAFVRSGV